MKNDYYDIAISDLRYLQETLHTSFYNQITVQAQQIAEKALKSVAEVTCVGIEHLLRGHNLRALYMEIHKADDDFVLDKGMLSVLKDYYYDAKYPGENFVNVDRDSCAENLNIMYDVLEQVNRMRKKMKLEVTPFERMPLGVKKR